MHIEMYMERIYDNMNVARQVLEKMEGALKSQP